MCCDLVGDGPASAEDDEEEALEKEFRVGELSRRRLHGDERDMSESTASFSPEFVSSEGPKLGRGRDAFDAICDASLVGDCLGTVLVSFAGGEVELVLGDFEEGGDEWLRRFRRRAAINASWALLGLSGDATLRA